MAYTKSEILRDIRECYEENGSVTQKILNKNNKYCSYNTVINNFNSFVDALIEVGIEEEYVKCEDCKRKFRNNQQLSSHHTKSECESSTIYKSVSCSFCSEIFYVNPSIEDRSKFCSLDCFGKWRSKNIQGENHPRYKENSTDQINYRGGWKRASEKARQRDGGCVYCGMGTEEHEAKYGFKPPVHHKQRYKSFEDPYEANQLENLITLCCKHHRQIEEGEIETPN